MATNQDINDALTTAGDLRLDPRAIVKLCDRAAAEMLVDKTPKSYQILGKEVVFQTFDDIAKVRAYFAGKVGIVAQDAELSW